MYLEYIYIYIYIKDFIKEERKIDESLTITKSLRS